ncbi:MAG: hypothetical protein IBX58_08160 [Roseovarius sp.]|nr:hypothetical protein [Roseovarius sp.]
MSERNRSSGFKVVTALVIAVIAILVLITAFDSGREYGKAIADNATNSRAYSSHAEQEIRGTCFKLHGPAQAECIRRVIEATNESQRAEKDLIAQTEMALWAFWMLIVTTVVAIITGFGVFYVWQTLRATREMVQDTRRMAIDAREIGEAQVRAYLSIESVIIKVFCNIDSTLSWIAILKIRNSGQSPARNVTISFDKSERVSRTHSEYIIWDLRPGEEREINPFIQGPIEGVNYRKPESDNFVINATISAIDVFNKPISIEQDYTGTVPRVSGDGVRLMRVYKNIFYKQAVWHTDAPQGE